VRECTKIFVRFQPRTGLYYGKMTDGQRLLTEYATSGSEAAFRDLLTRYLNLVYSTAVRLVGGDTHLAEDVTQTVFIDLARAAPSLAKGVMVGGWLHRHTCYVGSKTLRGERRRQLRERQAVEMNSVQDDHSESNLAEVAPILDDAIEALGAEDRTAILLRFFEQLDLRAVGDALGTSEEAARKRVSRALDQLHFKLTRRGITLSAAALGTALAAEAVTAAPPSLAAATMAAALSGTATTTATVLTATKAMAMTTLQKAALTATLAIVAGAGIHQAYKASQLRDELQALRQQQTPLAEQIRQLQRERDDAARRLASLPVEKSHDTELLKLRAEVTALRQTARERASTESTAGSWATRIVLLKQRLDQMPDKRIPEMAFLTDKDWAAATRDADLSTDDGVRQAMRALRSAAKDNFLNAMRDAFKKYVAAANGGDWPGDPAQLAQAINANASLLPADLAQLKPYFDVPIEEATLHRYQLLLPGKLHDNLSDILVKEIAPPVDTEYDTHHEMGLYSGGVGNVNQIAEAVAAAARDYAQANNGQMPSDPAQIARYLKQPLETALVQKYLNQLPPTAPLPGK
jgi:RNA polymerase sigma factor (sigma-70 family)